MSMKKNVLLAFIATVIVFLTVAGVTLSETSSLMKCYENGICAVMTGWILAAFVAGYYYCAEADRIIAEKGHL